MGAGVPGGGGLNHFPCLALAGLLILTSHLLEGSDLVDLAVHHDLIALRHTKMLGLQAATIGRHNGMQFCLSLGGDAGTLTWYVEEKSHRCYYIDAVSLLH